MPGSYARARGSGGAPLVVLSAAAAIALSCAVRAPCAGLTCAPACPRGASRDRSGRCACEAGTLEALGACVSPAVADAYCGPAARMGPDGCVARSCAPGERVDVARGVCSPPADASRGGETCGDGGVAAARGGRAACLSPEETCPQGTHRSGGLCAREPRCPPGTLQDRGGCRPIVTAAGSSGPPRVDVGAWLSRVLGVDGGAGSEDLCRAVAWAGAFDLPPGGPRSLSIHVALAIEGQDPTRAAVSVRAALASNDGGVPSPLAPPAAAAVEAAVSSLVDLLRGLGGESSTSAAEVTVRCEVGAP